MSCFSFMIWRVISLLTLLGNCFRRSKQFPTVKTRLRGFFLAPKVLRSELRTTEPFLWPEWDLASALRVFLTTAHCAVRFSKFGKLGKNSFKESKDWDWLMNYCFAEGRNSTRISSHKLQQIQYCSQDYSLVLFWSCSIIVYNVLCKTFCHS